MRFHNITKDDMNNGDGLRVVLWVAGCSHCCKDCQNPITWNPDGGVVFDEDAKMEIFEQLSKPYISGITFSGGDPLHQANISGIRQLSEEIHLKFPDKTQWLYTGYLWEEIYKDSVIKYIDVVVDGEFDCTQKDNTLMWKGSKNQRVINVKKTFEQEDISKPVLHCPDYSKL